MKVLTFFGSAINQYVKLGVMCYVCELIFCCLTVSIGKTLAESPCILECAMSRVQLCYSAFFNTL